MNSTIASISDLEYVLVSTYEYIKRGDTIFKMAGEHLRPQIKEGSYLLGSVVEDWTDTQGAIYAVVHRKDLISKEVLIYIGRLKNNLLSNYLIEIHGDKMGDRVAVIQGDNILEIYHIHLLVSQVPDGVLGEEESAFQVTTNKLIHYLIISKGVEGYEKATNDLIALFGSVSSERRKHIIKTMKEKIEDYTEKKQDFYIKNKEEAIFKISEILDKLE